MKVAEYVAEFLSKHTSRVYGVCGAGAMHLNDAIANHPGLNVISMQHEQAATMAAEADARVTGGIGVVSVTAGPGGSNTITGLACAYVDSIPLLVIAGQVTTNTMIGDSGLRQKGMNELPMADIVRPVTKYAGTVHYPGMVRAELEAAIHLATHGRPGPVWIEIPLDIQAAEIDLDTLPPPLVFGRPRLSEYTEAYVTQFIEALDNAERPLILIGNGVRIAGAIEELVEVVEHLNLVPVVSSWGAADILPATHLNYLGRCGIFGDRASNFAVQSADLILVIGSRLSVAQIGHHPQLFAPNAKKIIVDIDRTEAAKDIVDISMQVDAKEFLTELRRQLPPTETFARFAAMSWYCSDLAERYAHKVEPQQNGIGAYAVVDALSRHMEDDTIVVTDVGFSYIPTFQTLRLKAGQRLIHSSGVSPMGWGIPAAIGACMGGADRPVICLTGDGGAMLNIQELQTIAHHKLPIAIFVYENDGYATMKIAQNNHFGREVMSGPSSGMTLPDFGKLARAFGLYTMEFSTDADLEFALPNILDIASQGPIVVVMHMDRDQLIIPRVQAKTENGKFLPTPLQDMWPYLPADEVAENMKGGTDVVERFDAAGSEGVGSG